MLFIDYYYKELEEALGKVTTVKKVAQCLHVSEETVRRLIRNKKVKAFQVKNHWEIYTISLKQYIRVHPDAPEFIDE